MGTLFSAQLECADAATCATAFHALQETLRGIDERMSVYHASEITRINAAAGSRNLLQSASSDTIEVLHSALRIARQSEGRFDPTILPLMHALKLLREDFGGGVAIDSAQVAQAQELVDYTRVVIAGTRVGLSRADMGLDLGAIAKGYALDRAAQQLKKLGVASFALNFGGHLLVVDLYHNTAILDPRDNSRVLAMCVLNTGSLSVSAQDKRFVRAGRNTIGHLQHPRYGTTQARLSAVYNRSATDADAWSTALFFTDAAEFERLTSRYELAALRLGQAGEIQVSAAWKRLAFCRTR